MNTIERIAPSFWASYLINGDSSGLDEIELAVIDAWLSRLNCGLPVTCEDYGFTWSHDAQYEVGGADCQTYTFLEP